MVRFNKNKHKKSKWITSGLITPIKYRDNLYKKLKLNNLTHWKMLQWKPILKFIM